MLLWLQSSSSSSIGRHSLTSVFFSSTFFDFLLEGRSESWVFAMTYTFPLLLAKCNCLISGRGGANGVATYRSRPTLPCLLRCGVKKKDWRKRIDPTRGPLLRTVSGLSLLWRRRPLSGLLLLCSWQEPKQTVVSFVLEKGRLNICWWFNMSKLTFIYCEANTSTEWETFINWFTVVFDMKDRAPLITQRSICTLCASKSSFNNNGTVFVSLARLDVCYSLNVLWVYGRAYGSTCRLFFFHFFFFVVSSYFVKSRCLHVWPPTGQHVFLLCLL